MLGCADWVMQIPVIVPVVATGAVAIINAIRTREVHRQVVPPSQPTGGRTLGSIVEGVHVASEVAAIEATRVRQAVLPRPEDPTGE